MFDQYERASQRVKQVHAPPIRPDIVGLPLCANYMVVDANCYSHKMILQSTAGFIEMKLEDDSPIFTKQKVNFLPPDKILHLAVSSNTTVIAMANNILLRIDTKQSDKAEG